MRFKFKQSTKPKRKQKKKEKKAVTFQNAKSLLKKSKKVLVALKSKYFQKENRHKEYPRAFAQVKGGNIWKLTT